MKALVLSLSAAGLMLVPGVAAAAPAAAADAPAAQSAAEKPKLICRKEEGTGSRLDAQKICLTREGWRQRNLHAADAAPSRKSRRAQSGE